MATTATVTIVTVMEVNDSSMIKRPRYNVAFGSRRRPLSKETQKDVRQKAANFLRSLRQIHPDLALAVAKTGMHRMPGLYKLFPEPLKSPFLANLMLKRAIEHGKREMPKADHRHYARTLLQLVKPKLVSHIGKHEFDSIAESIAPMIRPRLPPDIERLGRKPWY